MATLNVKVDSKGRIIIPNSFRETLGIKNGENIVAQMETKNGRLILVPIEKKTKKLTIRFGDSPGTLARTAKILADSKVDLIYTSSRSLRRGKEAEWEVTADFSKTPMPSLKARLKKEKGVMKFRFEGLDK